mmetsp:Transcript_18138/g.30990  ORF Transcript_18138/g.30990 Transcript_18138/m.30990 type:complete len:113 (+) Transcript_18138:639-977(+)
MVRIGLCGTLAGRLRIHTLIQVNLARRLGHGVDRCILRADSGRVELEGLQIPDVGLGVQDLGEGVDFLYFSSKPISPQRMIIQLDEQVIPSKEAFLGLGTVDSLELVFSVIS